MGQVGCRCSSSWPAGWRAEENEEKHDAPYGGEGRHKEDLLVVDDTEGRRVGGGEPGEELAGNHHACAEDQQVRGTLGARSDVGGKHGIDENVNRRKEEGVADAVEHLDGDDETRVARISEQGEHTVADGMAEDADDHGPFPPQFFQNNSQREHGDDFGDLTDAAHHHGHFCGDADVGEKAVDHDEIAVVDHGIDERNEEEDCYKRKVEKFGRAQPGEPVKALRIRPGGSVGKSKAVHCERKREGAGHDENPPCFRCICLVAEQENERPAHDDPSDGPSHADKAKVTGEILQVGEGERVCYRDCGDEEKSVDKEEREEAGETLHEGARNEGDSADAVTEGEKTLSSKISISKLVAEKHAHQGCDAEYAADPALLAGGEAQHAHIREDLDLPGSPDPDFEDHHEKQAVFDG